MRSALYSGRVHHERRGSKRHAFGYRMHLMHLDLEELPLVFEGRWFWSSGSRNLVQFRRSDYLGPLDRPLREAVLDRVEEQLGHRPTGRVGILTQLRTFGYLFNPVTFYFCRSAEGAPEAIVAEITNTPWGERHAYVLDARGMRGERLVFRFTKEFHISPFHDMGQVYEWSFSMPGETLRVGMTSFENGRPVFTVDLACERRELTARTLALALVRSPLQPLRLHLAIYWQALRLYLKRTPTFVHPRKRQPVGDASTS